MGPGWRWTALAEKSPPWILVVDPDPRTGRMCADVFSPLGHQIHAARDGNGAWACIEELGWPAAVITELDLPDIDGLRLIQRLRRKGGTGTAAVMLTDAPSARSASQALRVGLDGYLIKGADSVSELRTAVQRSMRRRGRRRELERLLTELTQLNEAFMATMDDLNRTNAELEARIAEMPPAPEDPWRVLVVDDDVTIVALLETLLRSQGYDVEGATSGAQARDAFLNNRYDLVLTDKNLGDANGVDLIREIHAVHPDTRVLLMTGYATLESAVDAIESGVAGLLQKPFKDLGGVVNRVDEELAQLGEARAERRYFANFRARHAEFSQRYRLVKNKLGTLQTDRS